MRRINGQAVPEDLTLTELEQMLASSDMKTFAIACEALRIVGTHAAYLLLKKYIATTDQYKRRYVMSVIFAYREASELKQELLCDLQSDRRFLVTTALNCVISGKINVPDEYIFFCLERNRDWLDGYDYRVLDTVDKSEKNAKRVLELFHACGRDTERIAIAEQLPSFCTAENYLQFFDMTADDQLPKVRMAACCIAMRYGRIDLLQRFANDPDGHIRSYVLMASTMN